jgi:polyferredoxin
MFFSLDGFGIQWYILPAALIGSLFISDFFCHYFCPVGASFSWLIDIRHSLIKHLKKQNG